MERAALVEVEVDEEWWESTEGVCGGEGEGGCDERERGELDPVMGVLARVQDGEKRFEDGEEEETVCER